MRGDKTDRIFMEAYDFRQLRTTLYPTSSRQG